MLTARTGEFVEEILSPHFGGMISFVKECESLVERGALEHLKNQERKSYSLHKVNFTLRNDTRV